MRSDDLIPPLAANLPLSQSPVSEELLCANVARKVDGTGHQPVVTWAGRDFTLGIESYNLTNLRNEVEEWTLTGPLWRKPTLTQPPRVIRLTAGVTF